MANLSNSLRDIYGADADESGSDDSAVGPGPFDRGDVSHHALSSADMSSPSADVFGPSADVGSDTELPGDGTGDVAPFDRHEDLDGNEAGGTYDAEGSRGSSFDLLAVLSEASLSEISVPTEAAAVAHPLGWEPNEKLWQPGDDDILPTRRHRFGALRLKGRRTGQARATSNL